MAKVNFTKLNKVKSLPAQDFEFYGSTISIEQYVPLEQKINLIETVIAFAGDEVGFFNLVKLEAYYRIEMIRTYTNINFTEKQLEDPAKLYDALILNDVWAFVEDKIPVTEREYIWHNILELAERITQYNNSVLGILKTVTQDKENLQFDVRELLDKITDPEQVALLKQMFGQSGLIN